MTRLPRPHAAGDRGGGGGGPPGRRLRRRRAAGRGDARRARVHPPGRGRPRPAHPADHRRRRQLARSSPTNWARVESSAICGLWATVTARPCGSSAWTRSTAQRTRSPGRSPPAASATPSSACCWSGMTGPTATRSAPEESRPLRRPRRRPGHRGPAGRVIRSARQLSGGAYARWQDLLDRHDVPGLVAFAASPDGLSFRSTLVGALGRDLQQAKEFAACRAYLRAAVDRYPHDAWLHHDLAVACMSANRRTTPRPSATIRPRAGSDPTARGSTSWSLPTTPTSGRTIRRSPPIAR